MNKTEDERLNNKLQMLADLIADKIWDDYQNGILKSPKKVTNVSVDKVDPTLTERFTYGSR